MIKRILGIRKLEEFIKELSEKMGNHWEHTNSLRELHLENRTRIEKLEKNMIRRSSALNSMMENIISKLENAADKDIREYVTEEVVEDEGKIEILDNDLMILQILHDNACFDSSSTISTGKIFENVPFTITKRGLRKKLKTLLKKGLIGTVKRGNERYWHIKTGKISDVKGAIKAKEKRNAKKSKSEQS